MEKYKEKINNYIFINLYDITTFKKIISELVLINIIKILYLFY